MPEENKTLISSQPTKTEIVAAIPVKEPARSPTEQVEPITQAQQQPTSPKSPNQLKPDSKITEPPKPTKPENHHHVVAIMIACLVAIGLSIAAAMAFKNTI